MLRRLAALILKELLVTLRDPRGRSIVIVAPIVQLVVFAFAATLEVRNAEIAIVDLDQGRSGREITARLDASPVFARVSRPDSLSEARMQLEGQEVLAVIVLAGDLSRRVAAGRPAEIQLLLDGRRANAAQILQGYVAAIIGQLSQEIAATAGRDLSPPVVVRHLYNADLDYLWFTVPSLIAIITMAIGLVVTALSVARERELGTFDQLLVSPLSPGEILIGKTVPAVLIGMAHGTLYIAAAVWLFGIPLQGSLALLYLAMLLYILSIVGVGLFVSSLATTQQQAILGVFVFMVPSFLLSGFASPVENMPGFLQPLAWIDPPRWFLVIARGVFLKDMPVTEVLANLWPLLPVAAVTLAAASWLFRARSA